MKYECKLWQMTDEQVDEQVATDRFVLLVVERG